MGTAYLDHRIADLLPARIGHRRVIYKISNTPDLGVGALGQFINTSRAMGIVSAILLSVVIAFTCGTFVMYVSRTIFSFRYTLPFRRFGSMWCGASLTAIVYFAVFKGLKSILAGHDFVTWWTITCCCRS